MPDLKELYQEVIVDHSRRPHNFGPLPEATHHAEGFNPLCGDHLTLRLQVIGGVIQAARFEGGGCAISTASASLMTEVLKGKTPDEAQALFAQVHALVTGGAPADSPPLGKLRALGGVQQFPARVKCATLAWHTLQAALRSEQAPVSTEDAQ